MILFVCCICGYPASSLSAEELTDSEDTTTATTEADPYAPPETGASSIIVMDALTGQIIYEKNAYQKMYPASITKLMTALLAVEKGTMNATVTMSNDAVWGIDRYSSHIALDVGEEITLEDALYATLLVSANEAAWGVAEHIGNSLSNFCDMMNARATELGCINTHFVNANGLHDDNHYTCAYDMALIAKEAIKHEEIMTITSTVGYTIKPTNLQPEERKLWQDNKLIKDNSEYYYPYCQGGKTGYTDEAGATLVTWSQKEDMQLICVILGSPNASTSYYDTTNLCDFIFKNYHYENILEAYEFSPETKTDVSNYMDSFYNCTNVGTIELKLEDQHPVLIKDSDKDKLAMELSLSDELLHKNIVGTMTVKCGDTLVTQSPVSVSGYIGSTDTEKINDAIDNGDIRVSDFKKKINIAIIVIIIIIIAVGVFLFLRYQQLQQRRKQAAKKRRNNNQ